jgi:hypothetical protein
MTMKTAKGRLAWPGRENAWVVADEHRAVTHLGGADNFG